MDEKLDYYSTEEMLRRVSSQLMITHTSTTDPLEKKSSKILLQSKNYHLHLIENQDASPDKIVLPSTKIDRLAFYRQYMTSVLRTQLFFMQTSNVNLLFWNNVFNVILISLPHTYVSMFLASYTPEQHLFVPKMVPFFWGFKLASIMASFIEINVYLTNVIIMFAYLIDGITLQNPWNRCGHPLQNSSNTTCYEIKDFAVKITNETWRFAGGHYRNDIGENFQLAQVLYFRWLVLYMPRTKRIIYFTLIMTLLILSHKFVNKRSFWKMYNILQSILLGMDLLAFLYLVVVDWEDITKKIYFSAQTQRLKDALASLAFADIEMLAASVVAPPVVHVLTSRSAQEVHPDMDSTALLVSSLLVFILKTLLYNKLILFCQHLARTPIKLNHFNPYSFFYLWPIFLSTFYFGNIFTLLLLTQNFIVDFMTLAVTNYCFLEMIMVEWKRIKLWMITIVMLVCSVTAYFTFEFQTRLLFQMYVKGMTTLAELVVVCFFYPVGRLVDDITFHTGTSPPILRILTLKIMPIYYCIKLCIMYNTLNYIVGTIARYKHIFWFWTAIVVPIILGIVYIAYKYIIKDKRGWIRLFAPNSEWGPQDHDKRRLRKIYDSRTYIGSQAIRSLSRYMFEKSESNAFHLDLNYNLERKFSSVFQTKNEKKVD